MHFVDTAHISQQPLIFNDGLVSRSIKRRAKKWESNPWTWVFDAYPELCSQQKLSENEVKGSEKEGIWSQINYSSWFEGEE